MNVLKLILLLVLTFPIGCIDDHCSGPGFLYTDITEIAGQNVRLLDGNYRNSEMIPDQTSVSFETYALQVTPSAEYTNQRAETIGGWHGTAYACEPVIPQPFEIIADITVSSSAAYQQASSDKVIAAGESLNNILKIYDYYSGRIVGLPDFLLDKPLAAEEGFLLLFTTAPTQETTHTFTVRYVLDNGEAYEFIAPPVTITP